MLTTNVLLVAVPALKCTLQARILLGGLVDRYCTHLGKLLSDPKVEPGGNCSIYNRYVGINQTKSAS